MLLLWTYSDDHCLSGCMRVVCTSSGGSDDANFKSSSLVITSSIAADCTHNAHVYNGQDVSSWKDCEIPGQFIVYYGIPSVRVDTTCIMTK